MIVFIIVLYFHIFANSQYYWTQNRITMNKIAEASGVSLDYLAGEGINASFVKQTLIRDYKTQQAFTP